MTKSNEHQVRKKDNRHASIIIAIFSVVGLVVCFVYALSRETSVPLILYAIFGGGILGTDNILNIIKSVFRIDR